MRLRLESRAVGDVLIVQCFGRIITGSEVSALHAMVGDSIPKYPDIVLQFDEVEFIDSSGLGALMRLMQAARSRRGDLKLSGLPANIRKTLEMTHLLPQFETYDAVEEAITAAYLGSRYSPGKGGDSRPRVLCIYESPDVRTFLREVLCSAGYNALTTGNIDDAKILLKATKSKTVLVSAHMQAVYGKPTHKWLTEIDPTVSVVVLDKDFSALDPGQAAEMVVNSVRDMAASRDMS